MSKTTCRVYKIAAAAAFTAGSVAAIPATFAAEAPADQQVVDQKATAQILPAWRQRKLSPQGLRRT